MGTGAVAGGGEALMTWPDGERANHLTTRGAGWCGTLPQATARTRSTVMLVTRRPIEDSNATNQRGLWTFWRESAPSRFPRGNLGSGHVKGWFPRGNAGPIGLAAARRRSAVHALVAGAAPHGDGPAVRAGRCVAVDHEGQALGAVGDRVLDDQLDLLVVVPIGLRRCG